MIINNNIKYVFFFKIMAFITTSNLKKILSKLNLEIIKENLNTPIYKKEIYFFSKKEIAFLRGFSELLKNHEIFFIYIL